MAWGGHITKWVERQEVDWASQRFVTDQNNDDRLKKFLLLEYVSSH